MERQISISELAITPCGCSSMPKGYHRVGGNTYFLECSPCGKRTARHASIKLAAADWNNDKRVAIPVVPQPRQIRAVR